MKRFASTLFLRLLLATVLGFAPVAPVAFGVGTAFAFSGSGSGTLLDPYQITTCAQLDSINAQLTADYELENDIDCSGAALLNSGSGWIPIGQGTSGFQGVLDGQNHKIINLDLSGFPSTLDNAGMFDTIAGSGLVKNLLVMSGKINGHRNVGMIAGEMYNSSILSGVYASATVTGSENCGGLVGALHDSAAIDKSGADVTITDSGLSTGGLVGWIAGSNAITQSYANGTVSGGYYLGGLVGAVNNGASTATISNAYANVNVTSSVDYVGGLVGLGGTVNISNAYAVGSVAGVNDVAGLVGLSGGTINESFAANTVAGTGSHAGPVTGENFSSVTNSYFDANKTGFSSSTDGSTAETDSSTFIDNSTNTPMSTWNFTTIWRINFEDYPSFAPLIDPYMLCEAPQSTDTTITGHCLVQPLGWGTPTWEARWSMHNANSWHTVTLGNIHHALATVTGLTPGTQYDLEFRFTNDFGTGSWGRLTILTTGTAPVVTASVSTSSTSYAPDYYDLYGTPVIAKDVAAVPTVAQHPIAVTKPAITTDKTVDSSNTAAYLWLGSGLVALLVVAFLLFRPRPKKS